MSTFFATPSALLAWLKALSAEHAVVAPKTLGTLSLFKPWSPEELAECSSADVLLKRTNMSPKETVLPKCETLYHIKGTKDELDLSKIHQELVVPMNAVSTVLFGGRPCDARGFVALDNPYLEGPFVDPYYKARRDKLCIITQACTNAMSTCFCNLIGSNPADTEGSDIIFTPVADGFVFQAVSEKGETLLAGAGFAAANDAQNASVSEEQAKAVADLPTEEFGTDVPAKVYARFTDEAFWARETEKCLSCGACTYICPTCQCFTITDEGNQLSGERMRSWDSCMASHFTLEASGHNPRMNKARRYRNRIGHKFSYARKDGDFSCVGCGRCVRSCPAHLDIRTVVRHAVAGENQE